MNENAIIHTIPAAGELHKVPGFDPMKHLSPATNDNGETVMRLEPRLQRLWFRLACPKGRMLLDPLRVTDQMAIFEAKVFFHRDDPTPASSFTANKTVQDTPNYIRAAQDEALREALDNAGFGIQLCDVAQAAAPQRSEPAPPVQVNAEKTVQAETQPAADVVAKTTPAARAQKPEPAVAAKPETPVQEPAPAPEAVSAAVQNERPEPQHEEVPAAVAEPDTSVQEPASVLEAVSTAVQNERQEPRHEEKTAADSQHPSLAAVLNFPAPVQETAAPQENITPEQTECDPAAHSYTDSTPVEEILQVMTLEDANAVVVPRGPCQGWTMAQVAERRPSSLRFYLTSFCECSNIQKAAATLLIRDSEQKKAG